MGEKRGYAGRISNTGAQKVEAVFENRKKSKAKLVKGEDLRSGQPKEKGKK